MKKVLVALVLVLLIVPTVAFAATGDVAGKIYSTDILTFVNGKAVDGYNIGGKTAVIVEDLDGIYRGFFHTYDDETRTLMVDAYWHKNFGSTEFDVVDDSKRGQVGEILGDIYETDIKVFVNGSEVTGYNIGGKTAVCVEDLGTVEENPNSEFGYSKYLCNFEWDGENRTVSLNTVNGYNIPMSGENVLVTPSVKLDIKDNVIKASYNPLNFYQTHVYSTEQSEEFAKDEYVLKPLGVDINGMVFQVGTCFVKNYYDVAVTELLISDLGMADALLSILKTAPVPCEEALSLFDNGEEYKTLEKIETEDFYFLAVEDLKTDDENNDVMYIAVKKSGGYANVYSSSTRYTERIFTKVGENEVKTKVYPEADPHGNPAYMAVSFNLNSYIF